MTKVKRAKKRTTKRAGRKPRGDLLQLLEPFVDESAREIVRRFKEALAWVKKHPSNKKIDYRDLHW
jgi:hypothetical protein